MIDDELLLTFCWAFSASSSSSIQMHASSLHLLIFPLPFASSGVQLLVALWCLCVTVLKMFLLCNIVEFLVCPISLFLMVYFSPLTLWPKLETKQEQSNVTWLVFQIPESSKVKISQATVLCKKHLLALAQFFPYRCQGSAAGRFGIAGKLYFKHLHTSYLLL